MKRFLLLLTIALALPAAAADTLQAEKLVLNATATQVDLAIVLRKGIELQNLGPNAIYCVLSSLTTAPTVTLTKARKLNNGDAWSLDIPPGLHIWCKAATADQVTGAATIVTEVR